MSEIDIKDAVQGLGEAFEEFKKANDEKLDALEAGKGSDPLEPAQNRSKSINNCSCKAVTSTRSK